MVNCAKNRAAAVKYFSYFGLSDILLKIPSDNRVIGQNRFGSVKKRSLQRVRAGVDTTQTHDVLRPDACSSQNEDACSLTWSLLLRSLSSSIFLLFSEPFHCLLLCERDVLPR